VAESEIVGSLERSKPAKSPPRTPKRSLEGVTISDYHVSKFSIREIFCEGDGKCQQMGWKCGDHSAFNEKRLANPQPLGSTVYIEGEGPDSSNKTPQACILLNSYGAQCCISEITHVGQQEILKAKGSHFSQGIM
jgi:hypothetical protein